MEREKTPIGGGDNFLLNRREFLRKSALWAGRFVVKAGVVSAGFVLGDSTLHLIKGSQGKSEQEINEEVKSMVINDATTALIIVAAQELFSRSKNAE